MTMRETLRLGRKAFIRGDWKRAKLYFLEVVEGNGSEEERRIAKRYLKEVYLQEGRLVKGQRKDRGFTTF